MRKTAKTVNNVIELLGMLFLLIMICVVSIQVGGRMFFSKSPRWVEEVAGMLMVWFAFIGMSIGIYEGIHVSISFFTDLLPKTFEKIVLIADEILIMFYGLNLVYFGSKLIYATRISTLPATKWPAFMPYLMTPLAGVTVILFTLVNIMNIVQDKKREEVEVNID